MGLMPNEYYRLTPVEFGLMYSGYRKKETKQDKKLRLLSWFIVSTQCDMKGQSMEAWWPIGEEEGFVNDAVDPAKWTDEEREMGINLIKEITGG